ncbi:MAG: heavy-metal-associated domain-containing protein [Clostridia bacterium]|nr:heavy-metal-associated domain-containing protein [Clostridia bacterium]
MTDIIIIAIIIVIAAIGIRSAIRHFRGQGGCCGGGDYRPRKKKLKNILYTKTFTVTGMHCDHCRNRVEEVVNDMEGVAGKVDLKKGELTVSYAVPIDDERIAAGIEKAGYTVTGCKG